MMKEFKHPAGPILQAYHDEELDASTAAQVTAHCEKCADCRAELDDLKRLSLLLTGASAPELPRTVWHRVRPGRPQPSRLKPAFGLAACALGIVLGILMGPIQFSAQNQADTQLAWSETATIWDSGASADLLGVYQTFQE